MKHLIPINDADNQFRNSSFLRYIHLAIVETILIECIKAGFCDLPMMKHLIPINYADNQFRNSSFLRYIDLAIVETILI